MNAPNEADLPHAPLATSTANRPIGQTVRVVLG